MNPAQPEQSRVSPALSEQATLTQLGYCGIVTFSDIRASSLTSDSLTSDSLTPDSLTPEPTARISDRHGNSGNTAQFDVS